MACEAFIKKLLVPALLAPGAEASAIHGPLSAQGCTPAEPYPLNRNKKKNFQKKSPSPLTNHIPVCGLFCILEAYQGEGGGTL
jgi:hypothetical protein